MSDNRAENDRATVCQDGAPTERQEDARDCRTCRLLLPLAAPHDAYTVCSWRPPAWPANVMQGAHDHFSIQQDHRRWIPRAELLREPTRLRPCPTWEPAA